MLSLLAVHMTVSSHSSVFYLVQGMAPFNDIGNSARVNSGEEPCGNAFSAASLDAGPPITCRCRRCSVSKDASQFSPIKSGPNKGKQNTICQFCRQKRVAKRQEEAALPVIALSDLLRTITAYDGASAEDIKARVDTTTLTGQTCKEKADGIARELLAQGHYRFK